MRAIRPMPGHRHYADGLINIGGWWAVNGLQGVPVSAYAQSVSPPTLRNNPPFSSSQSPYPRSGLLVRLVGGVIATCVASIKDILLQPYLDHPFLLLPDKALRRPVQGARAGRLVAESSCEWDCVSI